MDLKRKTIWTILIGIIIVTFLAVVIENTYREDNVIKITKNSSQMYLDSLTTSLNQKGIKLTLDTIGFNGLGQLQNISGAIYFTPDCSGTFSTDNLDKIIIKKIFTGVSVNVNTKEK